MLSAANLFKNDLVIRVTGDDILIDPHYVDKLVNYHSSNNFEYSNNKLLPGGTEVEIFHKEFQRGCAKSKRLLLIKLCFKTFYFF